MAGFVRTFCIFTSLALVAGARTHKVDGLVVAVNPPSLTVAHRPVPGYMQAMTMDFEAAKPAELKAIQIGMRVQFEAQDRIAHSIRIVKPDLKDMPVTPDPPQPGSMAADFELTDHHGQKTRLSDFKSKVVAINFLYTRCPMPEVCPRLAATFASLHRRFATPNLILLSITLDPEWDTPERLAVYAKLWRTRDEGWRFLTGSTEAIRNVAANWGLIYWPEEGAIVHTSRTVIIDRQSRIAAVVEGSSYRVDQLTELIRRQLEKAK